MTSGKCKKEWRRTRSGQMAEGKNKETRFQGLIKSRKKLASINWERPKTKCGAPSYGEKESHEARFRKKTEFMEAKRTSWTGGTKISGGGINGLGGEF